MISHVSCVWFFATLWTVAHQAPLSLGFSRQEHWSGLPCLPPGDLPHPRMESASLTAPALASRFYIPSATWGRRRWHPTPALLPGKSHGRSSLVGCSPCGGEESDPTERLHFHFSISCIGEGNGNPLQCSCLENPRDKGAWWAAIYGVTESQTRLKRLSSSATWEARNIYKEKRIIKTVFTSLVDVRICLYGNSQRRLMLCYSLTSVS